MRRKKSTGILRVWMELNKVLEAAGVIQLVSFALLLPQRLQHGQKNGLMVGLPTLSPSKVNDRRATGEWTAHSHVPQDQEEEHNCDTNTYSWARLSRRTGVTRETNWTLQREKRDIPRSETAPADLQSTRTPHPGSNVCIHPGEQKPNSLPSNLSPVHIPALRAR